MPMMQFYVALWRILDTQHIDVVKATVALIKKFAPYIMTLTKKVEQTGRPIVRTMIYEFPNQGFEKRNDQFMLDENVLIAPVYKKMLHKK